MASLKINWEHIYLYTCLSIITAGCVLFAYWYFIPQTITTIDNKSISTDKKEYQSGDRIIYSFDYCKYSNNPSFLIRSLVDGVRINYDTAVSNMEMGCHHAVISDLLIPAFVSSGTYHLDISIEYTVNPLRKQIINFKTRDFEVKQISEIDNSFLQHEAEDNAKFDKLLK